MKQKNIKGDVNLNSLWFKQLPDLSDVKVEGDFHCYSNQLTSLKGAPKYVEGNFNCYNNHLTSLEGAPEYVGGDFNCSFNQLVSLEGIPKFIGGDFICKNNKVNFTEEDVRKVCNVRGRVIVNSMLHRYNWL